MSELVVATMTPLRKLAKAYANGQLSREDYRTQRGAFLHAVCAGSKRPDVIDYLPLVQPTTTKRYTTAQTSVNAFRPRSGPAFTTPTTGGDTLLSGFSSHQRALVAAGVVALGCILAVLLYSGEDETSTLPATTPQQAATPAFSGNPSIELTLAGEALLSAFLKENVWTRDKMDTFVSSWLLLSQEERQTCRDNCASMKQFTQALENQVKEQRALASIGQRQRHIQLQQELLEFAAALKIDMSRVQQHVVN